MVHPIIRYLLKNQVILALVIVVSAWFVIQIRDILMILFGSYIVMAALLPLVKILEKARIPKAAASAIAFFITVAFIILLIFPLVPFLVAQVSSLFEKFPDYLASAASFLKINTRTAQVDSVLGNQLANLGANALTITSVVFGGVFSLILVFVLSFYLMLDNRRIKLAVAQLFPHKYQENVIQTLLQVDNKLGAWARGQIILSISIGVFTWVALTFLNFSNVALPLAILAGILEIVPTIGPILSAVPAIIVALAINPSLAITVIIAYIIIQTIENNILVPKIMQHSVGLNPVIVIIAITIGTSLMGVIGGLLSIPFISMLIIIFQNTKTTLSNEK